MKRLGINQVRMQRFVFACRLYIWISLAIAAAPAILFAAEERTAVVDIGRVFDEYEKTRSYDAEFQSAGRELQKERDVIVYEIRRLRDEQALLSREEQETKQGEIDQKLKELDQFDAQAARQMREKRNTAVREIFQEIEGTLQQYGKRKGYDLILSDRAILYRDERFDITGDFLKELSAGGDKKKS